MICLLDTSGSVCRAGLADHNQLLVWKEIHEPMAHDERLAPLLQELFLNAGKDLYAIAIVSGPGSYTGLRIGAAMAKGLAYGLHVPLYAISMTQILAFAATLQKANQPLIQPVIDARRMEVYTAKFDAMGKRLSPDEALVVDQAFFTEGKTLIGDAVPKIQAAFGAQPKVEFMALEAFGQAFHLATIQAIEGQQAVDLAYWEPHYLKTFHPGPGRSA